MLFVICDLQPDVVQKLPAPTRQLWVDMVNLALQAARKSTSSNTSSTPLKIVYTMLKFEDYATEISMSHPRLGILRKLQAKTNNNPNHTAPRWFTSSELSVQSHLDKKGEHLVTRTTFLPQANDTALLEVLRKCTGAGAAFLPDTTKDQNNQNHNPNAQQQQQTPPTSQPLEKVYVCGYGPTVQAMCHLLGDVLAIPNVQILQECVRDENEHRCQAFLQHGLLFQEQVVSMAEFLDAMDLLHERIDVENDNKSNSTHTKYVCDTGRGGHLSLFLPYLLRDYGYVVWPSQPWYEEIKSVSKKQYYCPLGKRIVDLCDEPQFGSGTRFFLKGRQYVDEKNLLHDIVPEYMPPTFATVQDAEEYAAREQQDNNDNNQQMVWFLKKVNQNGGRAVTVTNELPKVPLEEDDQLQAHVPRPLLYGEDKVKCHVKTYQFIATFQEPSSGELCWKLFMHDLFYLATANSPWSTFDLSDDAQITTMRRVRLYEDHAWRKQWNLTERCHSYMQTVLERAIAQGKLQAPTPSQEQQRAADASATSFPCLQFEVNSADWMLDEDGRMYLIECNGIPVLYDPNMGQDLCTKGLNLYDGLYKENPKTAVVDDHDLLQEAIGLALTGKLPRSSLWKEVATIPHPTTTTTIGN